MLKLVVLAVLFVAVMGEAPQQGGGPPQPPPGGHPQKRDQRLSRYDDKTELEHLRSKIPDPAVQLEIVRQIPEGMPGGMGPMGRQGDSAGGNFPGIPPGMNPADMAKKVMDTAQNFASSVMSGRRRRNV